MIEKILDKNNIAYKVIDGEGNYNYYKNKWEITYALYT